jgi:hypothetical protein
VETLLHQNYPWFAQFFETQMLRLCVNAQYGIETDPSLRQLANPERLRKLQQRFSVSSSHQKAYHIRTSTERFFFKFVEFSNNYSLSTHLIVTLSAKLISLSSSVDSAFVAQKGFSFTKLVLQLKTLSKASTCCKCYLIQLVPGLFAVLALWKSIFS